MEVPVTADDGGTPTLRLTQGGIRFLPGGAERLIGLRIAVANPARALDAAVRRGLKHEAADAAVWLSGVRLSLLPPATA
jgi:hypothetical protein